MGTLLNLPSGISREEFHTINAKIENLIPADGILIHSAKFKFNNANTRLLCVDSNINSTSVVTVETDIDPEIALEFGIDYVVDVMNSHIAFTCEKIPVDADGNPITITVNYRIVNI